MTQPAPDLYRDTLQSARALGHALPALLAQAQQLAAALNFGAHGRRRAGAGDEFWQYRPAQTGDAASSIDWRRSARADTAFVREREWQALNTVAFWVDNAQSMTYSSAGLAPKFARAQLLSLALSAMLLRGGERVGLIGGAPARGGRAHLGQLAAQMADMPARDDYGNAAYDMGAPHARLVYLSDFLGPLPALQTAMTRAADRGARGVLLQILDPAEEDFPFSGRVIFQSMGGSLSHETQSAADLRAQYLDRLAARKDALATLARSLGWDYTIHHSDTPPLTPLIWAHNVLSGRAQ